MFRQLVDEWKVRVITQDPFATGQSNWETARLAYLSQLLLNDLLNHDFRHASQILSALAHRIEDLSEVVWKCGSEVFRRLPDQRDQRLPFLRRIFGHMREQREEILLEMTLILACDGLLAEAFDLLRSRLHQKPFKDNPLLRGYAGMLAYILWEKALYEEKTLEERDSSAVGFQSSLGWDLGSSCAVQMSQSLMARSQTAHELSRDLLHRHALQWFATLDGVPGSWDTFLLLRLQMLESQPGEETPITILNVLKSYCKTNPKSPNAYRYLCLHLKKLHADGNVGERALRKALTALSRIFPTCELVLDLPEVCSDTEFVIDVLMRYLDYPQCGDNYKAWSLLESKLRCLDVSELPKWTDDRQYWWPACYFSQSAGASFGHPPDKDLIAVRTSCAQLLAHFSCHDSPSSDSEV